MLISAVVDQPNLFLLYSLISSEVFHLPRLELFLFHYKAKAQLLLPLVFSMFCSV